MNIKKYWYSYALAVVAIIVLAMNWKKWFGPKQTTVDTSGRGRASATVRDLSVGENMAINKFKRDTANISESQISAKASDIQSLVNNMNRSFSNIGSDAKATFTGGSSSTARKKCADVAVNRSCTGYAGILFGTVCITWGCQ